MKQIIVFLAMVSLVACTSPKSEVPSTDPQISTKSGAGGVDVGNMTSSIVPQTNASLTFPASWKQNLDAQSLKLENSSGSTIEAKKSEIKDLASPNATSLQQYLQSKNPGRQYNIVDINGLQGVRADLVNTDDEKESDIYLVSETKDFVHIQSSLKKANGGIATGEAIIATTRVKYLGEAIPGAKPKTVTLPAYSLEDQTLRRKAAYSFLDECYTYVDQNCRGAQVLFGNGKGSLFSVGSGRIVDLGAAAETPFESVKIDGEYIVAPKAKVSIADVYAVFTPKQKNVEASELNLQAGHVYLIRTMNWPEEDLIVKMKVDTIDSGKSVTLTYQKLAAVKPDELEKQVEQINKYTIENEQPLEQGEMTLYNRSVWKNYYFSSFNFEFSTSGNNFITRNAWDLSLEMGCAGQLVIHAPLAGQEIGQIIDFGNRDIATLQKADFPVANWHSRDCGTPIEKGHVYGINNHRLDTSEAAAVYGAVQVLDIASDNSWVRFKFRRIHLGPAEHFQKWIELSIPEKTQSLRLDSSSGNYTFYPLLGKKASEASYRGDSITLYPAGEQFPNLLIADSRPYKNGRGFINLGAIANWESLSLADVESKVGQFNPRAETKKGDVIVVYLETYQEKTVMIMKVEDSEPGKFTQLSYKYLARAKASYLNEKN